MEAFKHFKQAAPLGPTAGDIGEDQEEYEFEPLPVTEPVREPSPTPTPAPEPVREPVREPVPA